MKGMGGVVYDPEEFCLDSVLSHLLQSAQLILFIYLFI